MKKHLIILALLAPLQTTCMSENKKRKNLAWTQIHNNIVHKKKSLDDLLKEGGSINAQDPRHQQTLAHFAVKESDLDLLRKLFDNDANLNIKDKDSKTPLHLSLLCIQLALQLNDPIDKASKIASYLIGKQKVDLDVQDSFNQTALIIAAKNNLNDLAAEIINNGANVHLKNNRGKTALDIAIQNENCNLGKLLIAAGGTSKLQLKTKPVYQPDQSPKYFYDLSARFNKLKEPNKKIIKEINENDVTDELGWTQLHHAVNNDDYELVKKLTLKNPKNIEIESINGNTPYTVALYHTATKANQKILKLFRDLRNNNYHKKVEQETELVGASLSIKYVQPNSDEKNSSSLQPKINPEIEDGVFIPEEKFTLGKEIDPNGFFIE